MPREAATSNTELTRNNGLAYVNVPVNKTPLSEQQPDTELSQQLFARISPDTLALAPAGVNKLIRPTDNVYFQELDTKYKTVRHFLPALAEHIKFGANAAGEPFLAAFSLLRANMMVKRPANYAHREIITKPWRRHK